ncbi:MAG: hypothetical protein CTY33_06970 [Methylotenera sp.]|nr:MAG: hypothetical protein CTY33_06970 [Methylotenera sp.]
MKFFREIAMVLILALASSPALAAICATSCASQSIMSSMHSDSMAGMKNCHEGSMSKDKHKSSTEHKSCAMGAGCQFTQVTPIVSPTKYVFTASAAIVFPSFVPSEKSVDLSPPLKPPA